MIWAETEKRIGYVFRDKTLLERAFTLPSYAQTFGLESNQRLEFLGDAVLEAIVSERLYSQTQGDEGEMTSERKRLVSDENLSKVVEKLAIKEKLRYVGNAAYNLGKKAIPSLFEALVAAIYLDGGLEEAKTFVYTHLDFAAAERERKEERDSISALKEYLEKHGKTLGQDAWKEERVGKDNAPEFTVRLHCDGEIFTGKGQRKKQAKQNAAQKALERLRGANNKEKPTKGE